MPSLEGPEFVALRSRFILMNYGERRSENSDEAWRMADILGAKGVPKPRGGPGPEGGPRLAYLASHAANLFDRTRTGVTKSNA